MRHLWVVCCTFLLATGPTGRLHGAPGPFDGTTFHGRIAISCDGNFNDEDDWGAFPVAAAILDAFGVTDRVVHVDYNNILAANNPRFYREMTTSVLGAADRYHIPRSVLFDCQKDLEGAVRSIAAAVNASSEEDPLYLIIAGPVDVPYRGIALAEAARRQYVYCISHSAWNDGFTRDDNDLHPHTKRDLISQRIQWVQVADGNRQLAHPGGPGKKSTPEQWRLYEWLRDAEDERLNWIFTRLEAEGRADISDSTMTYFLLTGIESIDLDALERLLVDRKRPPISPVRHTIRLEGENFQRLTGYEVDGNYDRNASHRLAIVSSDSNRGRIETVLDQPYLANRGRYDVIIRYLDDRGARSRIELSVNGHAVGAAVQTTGDGTAWADATIHGVDLNRGDRIALDIVAERRRPAKLDYLQLVAADNTRSTQKSDSPVALDDPDALPGQVIIAGSRPGYLKYNGGGPVFLCGPDNPEDFLFRGELNPDGTRRDGDQEAMIRRMARCGVNAFHCQMFRMRRCNIKDEGDDTHCPFVDHDPGKPLDEDVLAQWDHWLTLMEEAGIIVHLEYYNDATDVERMGWRMDDQGDLHPDERRFIEGIVNRFEHHNNILWGIEESCNKLPGSRTRHFQKIGQVIAEADDHDHPIVQSFVVPDDPEGDFPEDGITSDPYVGDPNIRVVTWLHVPPHRDDLQWQHEQYLTYRNRDARRFIVMKNETYHHPRRGELSRRYMWSCAMTGMHTLEAYHHADTSPESVLRDDGRICEFMEKTDFYAMEPRDALAAGSTKWVLARPGESYVLYTYDYDGPMGVKRFAAGKYNLLWYDTVTGREVILKSVDLPAGTASLSKPEELGNEIAVYITRH